VTALRAAVGFLTRLPVPAPAQPSLSGAAVWFPVVGLFVGGIAAGVRALADLALPPLPSTLLAIAVATVVTGALHEDGLADVADAIGAHVDRARRLEILRDPRVGAFGALALVLAVALVAASVAALDTQRAAATFAVAHLLARWAMLPVSRALPPARPGLGSLLRAGTPGLAIASTFAIAATLAVAGPAPGAAALAAATFSAAAAALILSRAFGGVTGDGYGATAKLAEVAVCVTLCAVWS
jgi:adenosylcobinamide-GDP ribazoletransferase